MHFKEFVKTMIGQTDPKVKAFANIVIADKDFPQSSDPSKLAIYLYKKLDPDLTRGFQFCLMVYSKMPDNKLPKMCFGREDMMLDAINLIVGLQNFDSEYKWGKKF